MPTPLITADDTQTFTLPGIQFTGLAAPSRGASESAVWIVQIQPGTPGLTHQLTREEVFIVLEGRALATLHGTAYELNPGNAFIVPPRTDFALANPFFETFRAVVVLPVGGQGIVGDDTFVPPWAQ